MELLKLSDYFEIQQVFRNSEFTQVDEADTSEQGSLVYCLDHKFLKKAIENDQVSCIITTNELAKEASGKGVVVSTDPRLDFFKLYLRLSGENRNTPAMAFGIGAHCTIHPSAVVSSKVKIGDNVVIGANAVIEDYSEIGDNSYIGSCVTIGAEGLVSVDDHGARIFIKHAGGVRIGKQVTILSNAVVAKSLFRSFTTIDDYSQIGILANVGHGAKLGKNCTISGNCVIAGRTIFGDNVWMGTSSSIAQGLRVGMHAQIKMGSVIIRNINENEVVSGNFALSHAKNMKRYVKANHE